MEPRPHGQVGRCPQLGRRSHAGAYGHRQVRGSRAPPGVFWRSRASSGRSRASSGAPGRLLARQFSGSCGATRRWMTVLRLVRGCAPPGVSSPARAEHKLGNCQRPPTSLARSHGNPLVEVAEPDRGVLVPCRELRMSPRTVSPDRTTPHEEENWHRPRAQPPHEPENWHRPRAPRPGAPRPGAPASQRPAPRRPAPYRQLASRIAVTSS